MPTERLAEVHVDDIGTIYRLRIYDDALPFDPSTSSVRQIRFSLPGGVAVTKDAQLEAEGSPASSWLLTYQVTPDAIPGSPPSQFHGRVGAVKMQAYLEWTDGSKYSSNVVTTDEDGRELRVHRNLA